MKCIILIHTFSPYAFPLFFCDNLVELVIADETLAIQMTPSSMPYTCTQITVLAVITNGNCIFKNHTLNYLELILRIFLPLFSLPTDEVCQTPTLTVLHNDIQCGVGSVNDPVMIAYNMRVS